MSIIGKGTKSIRKKSLTNTRNPVVGTKNITFFHQSSQGETVIDLSNLNVPSGFVNPSPSELAKARIKDFEDNLIIMSSLKGTLQRGLGYTIITNNTIKLNFEAEEGEIFSGLFLNVTINGTIIADVRTPGTTGLLLEGETDFALGEAIPIDDLNNDMPILVFRGINQTPMHRNTLNGTSGGNYQMLDNGDGYCSVIRFNDPGDVGDEPIAWSSRGALGERANLSVLQTVDEISGVVDRMKDDLLEVTEFNITDPTRYDGVPTNPDLKAFGDKVQDLLSRLDTGSSKVSEFTKTKVQTKTLSTDVGVNTSDIADLKFNNLTIGKWYRISGQAGLFADDTDAAIATFEISHDSNIIVRRRTDFPVNSAGNVDQVYGISTIFKATATTLISSFTETSSEILRGNGTQEETYLQLEELPNHEETTDWT